MVDFKLAAQKRKEHDARIARGEYATVIAGSRGLNGIGDEELVDIAVRRSGFKVIRVLSGTARGIDQAGEKWASAHNIPVDKYPADWKRADGSVDKGAGFDRNLRMAWNGDALIAIWDGQSRGTKHMIEKMRDQEKPVFVLQVIRYWISGVVKRTHITGMVVTDENDEVLWTCAALKVFVGQPIENLIGWMKDVQLERMV